MTVMTRVLRVGLASVSATIWVACESLPRVDTDRLAGTSFAAYRTFAFLPEVAGGGDPAFGPSAREVAVEALASKLEAKGLKLVEQGEAELLVGIGVSAEREWERGTVRFETYTTRTGVHTPLADVPIREDTWSVHAGDSVEWEATDGTLMRTVVVDVFESVSKRHLWRGTSTYRRGSRSLDLDDLHERVQAIAQHLPED